MRKTPRRVKISQSFIFFFLSPKQVSLMTAKHQSIFKLSLSLIFSKFIVILLSFLARFVAYKRAKIRYKVCKKHHHFLPYLFYLLLSSTIGLSLNFCRDRSLSILNLGAGLEARISNMQPLYKVVVQCVGESENLFKPFLCNLARGLKE